MSVTFCLGKLHHIHSFSSVPVQECTPLEHWGEL
jgi:hypothetical protein